MPIMTLKTLDALRASKHGLEAECRHCKWGKRFNLDDLLKTDRLLGYLTMDEFRARLCCKVCGRRDPHLWVTFYAPLK